MSEKKIASLEELSESFDDDALVLLKDASAKAGSDVFVRIRPLEITEFMEAYNFPVAEIDAIVQGEKSNDDYHQALDEHAKTLGFKDLLETAYAVCELAVTEPEIPEGKAGSFFSMKDAILVFEKTVALTMPKAGSASAARFRPDAERGSN